jgi:hypothetical protein
MAQEIPPFLYRHIKIKVEGNLRRNNFAVMPMLKNAPWLCKNPLIGFHATNYLFPKETSSETGDLAFSSQVAHTSNRYMHRSKQRIDLENLGAHVVYLKCSR